MVAFCADNLFQCMTVDAGALQNYIDVGAEDCGALISLGNTFANLAGPVTTALGVYLRARTGCASNIGDRDCSETGGAYASALGRGWSALLYAMASWQFLAAIANWQFCGVTRPDR